jgi:hypothetical protein
MPQSRELPDVRSADGKYNLFDFWECGDLFVHLPTRTFWTTESFHALGFPEVIAMPVQEGE